MAGPFDLTGLDIENTYQRVLQTDGTLIYDGTGSLFAITSQPAGSDQSIQFNDNGVTSGSGNFTFNKTTNVATLTGSLTATSFTGSLLGTATTASFLNSTTNAFIQNGNSFGTTALLGTNDSQSLALETSGSTRMFISSSGNVGIGTTTPSGRLDVSANLGTQTAGDLVVDTDSNIVYIGKLDSNSGNTNLIFRNRLGGVKSKWANAGAGSIWFGDFVSGYGVGIQQSGITTETTLPGSAIFHVDKGNLGGTVASFIKGNVGIGTINPSASLHISGASSANLLRIDSPASSSIIFVSGSGNVGIGTAAPTVALQVGDTTSTGNYIKVLGNNSDSTYDVFVGARRYPRLQLQDTTVGGSTFQMWSLGNTMRFGTNTGTTETSAWYTKSGNAADVIFNGNVGIGKTTPSARLDVSGNTIITGSLAVSASIFQYSNNAAITSGSTANIASFSTSSFTAGFFDFVATSGTNARAGTVFTVWNANNVEYAETSTNDIGNTTNLLLSASISAGAIRLQGTSLSGSWNVKTLTRMI